MWGPELWPEAGVLGSKLVPVLDSLCALMPVMASVSPSGKMKQLLQRTNFMNSLELPFFKENLMPDAVT